MINNRADPRHQLGVLAALMTKEGRLICFGGLEDVSAGGAKLKLTKEVALPKNFVIVLSSKHGPRRKCSLVWQKADKVGVRFTLTEE